MKSENNEPTVQGKEHSEHSNSLSVASSRESLNMLPTLCMAIGFDAAEGQLLRDNVNRRLSTWSEQGALIWMFTPDIPDVEMVVEAYRPLRSVRLWRWLAEHGYIHTPPSAEALSQIRIVVLVDYTGTQIDVAALEGIIEEARQRLEGEVQWKDLAIVWIGPPPDLGADSLKKMFWPRVRLESTAMGGVTVERRHMLEVVENFLVAFLSSNLLDIIEQKVGTNKDDVDWLVVGASALISRLDEIEEVLQEATVAKVLEDLLEPLSDHQAESVQTFMIPLATKIRLRLIDAAREALRNGQRTGTQHSLGWEIEGRNGNQSEPDLPFVVTKCELNNEVLLDTVFGAYRGGLPGTREWQKPHEWSARMRRLFHLLEMLAEPMLGPWKGIDHFRALKVRIKEVLDTHYNEVLQVLEAWVTLGEWRGVGPKAKRIRDEVATLISAFIDRGMASKVSSDLVARNRMWSQEERLPKGLRSALLGIFVLEHELTREPDLVNGLLHQREEIRPLPVGGIYHGGPKENTSVIDVLAQDDANVVLGKRLAYERFARGVASPWGSLIGIFPAWPLGAVLLNLLLGWWMAKALLWAGVAVVAVWFGTLTYEWWFKGRKYLHQVQHDIYLHLTRRILSFTALILQDYRRWLLTDLRTREFAMRILLDLFTRRLQRAIARKRSMLDRMEKKGNCTFTLKPSESTISKTVKNIVDELQSNNEWRLIISPEGASRREYKYENGVTGLIVENIWQQTPPAPAWRILNDLETEIQRHVHNLVRGEQRSLWMPGMFAQEVEELRDTRRLQWLMWSALPLGNVKDPLASFDVLLGAPEMLSGREIKQSPAMHPGIHEGIFRLDHEEILVRIVAEKRRGE